MQQATKAILKKALGIFLILLGLLALITPLTPGAWLAFIGLELLGFRLAFYQKFKEWWRKKRAKNTSEHL